VASHPNIPEPVLARARTSENWGSKLGVILAVAGSAVGLGNFLRFPGNAALNGGGIFMVPYFISLILLGIPICWVEWTMGRYGGSKGFNSAPGIFSVLWRNSISKYFGALALIVPVGIFMYYVYIEAWCLAYAWDYVSGTMASYQASVPEADLVPAFKSHFSHFVGMEYNGFLLRDQATETATFLGLQKSVLFLIIVFVINFILIYRGLTKGIEMFCKIAMPTLILFAVIVLVRVLTLGTPDPARPEANINAALGFMWNPKIVVKQEWKQIAGPTVQLSSATVESPTFTAPDVAEPVELTFRQTVHGGLVSEPREVTVRVAPGATADTQPSIIVAAPATEVRLTIDPEAVAKVKDQPAWAALADPQLWLAAAGQIFFTLSVGFGIILNYASYLRKDDDVVLSGLTATSTNEFCEVCLGGMITIPAAFLFLSAADLTPEVLKSGFQLGFMALPAVFAKMPMGNLFGGLWFFMLFAAAITSSLSMLQPAIAFLEEGFGMGRRLSVTCLSMLTATGGLLVVYFSKDLIALDVLDFWVGTVCIFVLATMQVLVVGWAFGVKRAQEESARGAAFKVPRVFWFLIKYVAPVYLLVIFIAWCYQNVPAYISNVANLNSEDRGTVLLMLAFIFVLLIFFGMLVHLAGKNWKAQGRLAHADREPQI